MSDLLTTTTAAAFDPASFAALVVASLVLGAVLASLYSRRYGGSRGFILTLALLPATVQTVIMLVNGNVGTGVAVAGAFSLIRFRSVPGTATEIGAVFIAMALGLACAMGQVVCAVVFLAACIVFAVLSTAFGLGRRHGDDRILKVTLPEGTDWNGLFDDLFSGHTTSWELVKVKTSNLGSLIDLEYRLRFKDAEMSSEFLDQVRTRNGNLPVACMRTDDGGAL